MRQGAIQTRTHSRPVRITPCLTFCIAFCSIFCFSPALCQILGRFHLNFAASTRITITITAPITILFSLPRYGNKKV